MNTRSSLAALTTASMIGLAGIIGSGAWAPTQSAGAAKSAASMPAGMAMPAGMVMPSTQAAKQTTILELHRRVVKINISNFAFGPAKVEVSPGTRVIWTNKDMDPHTVTSVKRIWMSDALDTAGTFSRAFKTTGSFAYYCSIHPFMHGMVVVKK
jgi:plastocyanin